MFNATFFKKSIIIGIFIVLLEGCAESARLSPVQVSTFRNNQKMQMQGFGASDLYIAIHMYDVAKVKLLVSKGADIEHVLTMTANSDDRYASALLITALAYRSSKNRSENQKAKQITQYLLDKGADADNQRLNKMAKLPDEFVAMIKPYQDGILGNSSNQKVFLAKQEKDNNELEKMREDNSSLKQSITQSASIPTQTIVTNTEIGDITNQRRTALVIGNSQYSYSPLKNPGNDAQDIADALKGLNFKVILKVDVAQREMEEAIEEFTNQLGKGGVGLFYYAGHGVQVSGSNYLIPIGTNINKQADVRYEAVNLGRVLDGMGEARNGLNIAILDACRDNPLPRSYRSSGKRGLVRVDSPEGTILAFSTSPGSVAQDGDGRNGLYTKYLLKHLKTKNISIENLLKRVSRDVKQMSGRKQNPWREFSFDGDFYF